MLQNKDLWRDAIKTQRVNAEKDFLFFYLLESRRVKLSRIANWPVSITADSAWAGAVLRTATQQEKSLQTMGVHTAFLLFPDKGQLSVKKTKADTTLSNPRNSPPLLSFISCRRSQRIYAKYGSAAPTEAAHGGSASSERACGAAARSPLLRGAGAPWLCLAVPQVEPNPRAG